MNQPIFSLCHTTRRIPGWEKAARAWIEAADNPHSVEYVLCVDAEEERAQVQHVFDVVFFGIPMSQRVLVFSGSKRRCAVDGWNAAAAASTGKFLITVSDDVFPPARWDTLLLEALGSRINEEAVVWVNSGEKRDLMAFSLLTRKYYERYGYIFYPEYLGMYGDDDFTRQALRDGVVIDCRKTLPEFKHLHPLHGTAPNDEVYEHQNRPEAYAVGKAIFEKRWPASENVTKRRIAVCLPGEMFSKHFLRAWSQVLGFLLMTRNFIVTPVYGHCSNVHVTRQSMANSVIDLPEKHEFVLWIDDDQVVTPQHVQWLLEALERFPEADMVGGWTYIQDEETGHTVTSCGKYTEDGSSVMCVPVSEMQRLAGQGVVFEVEWSGFPAVLMRAGVIEKANELGRQRYQVLLDALGEKLSAPERLAFAPVLTPRSQFGFSGEDVGLCINAKDAGVKILVDSKVFVEHMKLRAIRPPDARPANETPAAVPQAVPEENRVKRALKLAMEFVGG